MSIFLLILILMIVPAIGVLLFSTLRSLNDVGRALQLRAQAGRARPPGSLLLIPERLRKNPPTLPQSHRVLRGLALSQGRVRPGAAQAGTGVLTPGLAGVRLPPVPPGVM